MEMITDEIRAALRRLRYEPPGHAVYVLGEDVYSEAERRGLVARVPNAFGEGKHYELTDAGRTEAREGEDRGALTVDVARSMSAYDLAAIWGDHPVAQRQLSLSTLGAARVRGVLVACGEEHRGTGGWHVIPYVTPAPERRIGWVDTARGLAYLTDAGLDAETVQALTVPEQTPGPKASGAAAWSSPDAGGGSRTEAPTGWTQLVVDIRTSAGEVDEHIHLDLPELVAYGLVTCYGERGRPPEDLERVSDWPLNEDQRARVASMATEWLEDLRERIGPTPERVPWHQQDRAMRDAESALYALSVESPARGTTEWALQEYSLTWVGRAAGVDGATGEHTIGARRIDAVERALKGWAVERLTSVVQALPSELDAYTEDGQSRGVHFSRDRIIRTAAAELFDGLLRGLLGTQTAGLSTVEVLQARCREVLYERGAIITEAGEAAGVTCDSPPAKPKAERKELEGGLIVYRVPFGADKPEGYDHCLVLRVSDEIVCRPEDADGATELVLHGRGSA